MSGPFFTQFSKVSIHHSLFAFLAIFGADLFFVFPFVAMNVSGLHNTQCPYAALNVIAKACLVLLSRPMTCISGAYKSIRRCSSIAGKRWWWKRRTASVGIWKNSSLDLRILNNCMLNVHSVFPVQESTISVVVQFLHSV